MCFDPGAHFISQIVTRAVIESYVGAFAREYFTKRGANSPSSAGNECAFAFE